MQQVGDKPVSPNALVAEIGQGHALRQRAGADHLNAVGVQFHEDVGAVEKPVAVHHRIGDRFAQCLHRILRDVLASQALDSISGAGVALDEAHGILDVRNDAAVEILAVQDVNLVRAAPKQTSDVRIREEVAHVLSEEQHTGVAEQQPVVNPLRHFDVHQHVFHRPGRDAGKPQPRIELVSVEVLRVVEARAWREIKQDLALGAEEVAYLVTAELLRLRPLPPEEAVTALHRLRVAFPHLHHEHLAHPIRNHLHRRVTVAGDVLDPRPQRIAVLDALHLAVVGHAEQNPAADGVGERDKLSSKG